VAWKYKQAPAKPSPLLINRQLYLFSDSGIATCLDARTGKEIWSERIGGDYSASPVFADGRIYLCGEKGNTLVMKPGPKLDVLATNVLEDGFMSSPAVAGKALFLRTKKHLYRIEE
jgi:outer membrane protein assembly factor BamB